MRGVARGRISRWVRGVREESVGGGKGLRAGARAGGGGPQGKRVQDPGQRTDEGVKAALELRVRRGMSQGCVQRTRGRQEERERPGLIGSRKMQTSTRKRSG